MRAVRRSRVPGAGRAGPWGVVRGRRPTGRVEPVTLCARPGREVDRVVLVPRGVESSDYSATEKPEFLRSSTVVVCIDSMPSTNPAAERDSAALPKASLKAE